MNNVTNDEHTESRQLLRSAIRVLRAMGSNARVHVDGGDLVFLPGSTPAMLAGVQTFVRLTGGAAVLGRFSAPIEAARASFRSRLDEARASTISVNAAALGRVRRAVAGQDPRVALFAVLIDVAEGRLVAADGARMHVAEGAVRLTVAGRGRAVLRSLLLPAGAARLIELLRLESLDTDGRVIVARRQRIELFSEVAPGEFPDYRPCLGRQPGGVEVRPVGATDLILREVLRLCRSIDAARPILTVGARPAFGTVLVASRNHGGTWPWLWQETEAQVPAVVLDPVHLRDALAAAGNDALIQLPRGDGPVVVSAADDGRFRAILQPYQRQASR